MLTLLAPAWRTARADPVPSPSPHSTPAAKPKASPKTDDWSDARRFFMQLSPDQQQKFFDNLEQWKAMSPEEQALLRDQDVIRRQRMAQEIQDAIAKSGLQLDDDQREVYALRYSQERRKIEEELRKETQAKRQAMVADMLVRLKAEFSGPQWTPVRTTGTAGGK
ncbi:MAG: hypothetical protein ABSE62_04625 [Chthoniobacteraceae bacterium]